MAACAEIARLAQPSLSLDASDLQEVHKLAEVLKQFLVHRAERFVAGRLKEPMGEVIMQDITPLTTHTLHRTKVKGLKTVIRKGKNSENGLCRGCSFLISTCGARCFSQL